MPTTAPIRKAIAVAAMGVVLAACSEEPTPRPSELSAESSASASEGSESAADDSGSSSSAWTRSDESSASSSAAPTVDQTVLEVYKSYYNAIYTLKTPTDEQVRQAFTPYAEQLLVDNWVKVFAKFASNDVMPSGGVTFGPTQITMLPGDAEATVYECRDGTSETMSKISTGQVVSHGSPGTRIDSKLRKGTDGEWRVFSTDLQDAAC